MSAITERITINPTQSVEVVVYSVYGDESHDGKADWVYVVSGLFGNAADWDCATVAWLNITGGEEFHANEWSSRSEYGLLSRVIRDSHLILYVAGMDLREYSNIFPNPVPQLPYYFCFSEVVEHFATIASQALPRGTVKFTFDRNLEVRFNATKLYDCMIKFPEFAHWDLLADELGFATRKDARIQMADMVARETMVHFENIVRGSAAPRPLPIAEWSDYRRIHWSLYDKQYFKERVAHTQKLVAAGDQAGNYDAWRAQQGCQDNAENRIRHHIHVTRMLEAQQGGRLAT